MRLIRRERNLFRVDAERAFRKLRDDMITEPGGWFKEVIDNAIDAQRGRDAPIEIESRRRGGYAELVVADLGEGFDDEGLEAFHYMGRTTKRNSQAAQDGLIGRFGLGFVSVYSTDGGVRSVRIDTRPTGGAARCIEIRTSGGDAMPEWREVAAGADAPERGTRFTFRLDVRKADLLERKIDEFCAQTIVPVRWNGTSVLHAPRELAGRGCAIVVDAASDDGAVEVWCGVPRRVDRGADPARIYLRRTLAEEGSAHTAFGNGGDKMAQNCSGRPYLTAESIVAVSRVGEPTLSRDKLVRNLAFGTIVRTVNAARAKAVAHLLDRSRSATVADAECNYLANLYTLSVHLAAHLEGREYPSELAPAVAAVARYPYFETYDSKLKLSLEDVYASRRAHGVYLHARSADVAMQFSHTCPFTLKEETLFSTVFGGHIKLRCADLLGSVFSGLKSAEPKICLESMEHVLGSTALASDLQTKGVICRNDYRVEQTEIADAPIRAWFDELKTTLNQPWFRNALSAYDEVRTIRLLPVRVTEGGGSMGPEELAMQLRLSGVEPDEVAIGIRVDSSAARTLAAGGTRRENVLPTVVQVAACIGRHHFGTYVLQQDNVMQVACTQELLIDLVGLEDRVIHAALRHIEGAEADAPDGRRACVVL